MAGVRLPIPAGPQEDQFAVFPDSYEYTTMNAAAGSDVVMKERLDRVEGPDGQVQALPVMGTFVVRDGKIARWTDYWDTGLIGKTISGEDHGELVAKY